MPAEPSKRLTVRRIAELCAARLTGNGDHASAVVRRVAPIAEAGPDAVTWLAEEKWTHALAGCRAAAVIGSEQLVGAHPRGLVVDDTEAAVAAVLQAFHRPPEPPEPGVHPSAIVHPTAILGEHVAVGALAVLHEGVVIGDHSIIHEGVSLCRGVTVGSRTIIHDRCVIYDRCRVGSDVILHAGVVVGADGFGYIFRDGRHVRLQHLGDVVIEDEVEIGANSCVDRGKLGTTRIGRGSKIDNLVMVAHNVQIGPNCIVIAQCGIAGSTRLGEGVVLAGQVGVVHGLSIGAGARLAARATVFGDVPAGAVYSGSPAQDHKAELREVARVRRLGRLIDKIAALEKRVAELEGAADH